MSKNYNKQKGETIFTTGRQPKPIKIENIVYIDKCKNISIIHLNNKYEVLDTKTLDTFEKELVEFGFVRIHKKNIINGKYISEIGNENKKKYVQLEDIRLHIAKERIGFFNNWLLE